MCCPDAGPLGAVSLRVPNDLSVADPDLAKHSDTVAAALHSPSCSSFVANSSADTSPDASSSARTTSATDLSTSSSSSTTTTGSSGSASVHTESPPSILDSAHQASAMALAADTDAPNVSQDCTSDVQTLRSSAHPFEHAQARHSKRAARRAFWNAV